MRLQFVLLTVFLLASNRVALADDAPIWKDWRDALEEPREVHAGDRLQYYFYAKDQSWHAEASVSDDGKIELPVLGKLQAAGMPLSQLKRTAVSQLGHSDKQVNFFALAFVDSKLPAELEKTGSIKVTGLVYFPGEVAWHEGMTVFEALRAVGGLNDFAVASRVRLMHDREFSSLDLRKLSAGPVNKGGHTRLQKGDHIDVPGEGFW